MTITDIKKDKKFWQRMLRLGGYYNGAIDGIIGAQSRAAEEKWRADEVRYKNLAGTFDERSEGTLSTVLPYAQYLARQWMQKARLKAALVNIEVRLIDGTRTYAEQNALYNKKPKVTNAKGGYSWHNFGLAVDFGLFRGKEYLGESPYYQTLGALAREVQGLEWGGDWASFKDYPHLQMVKFASLAEARNNFGG